MNRTTHHLIQLTPGGVDAAGYPDPEDPPVCREVTKIDLRAKHQRKLDILRRQQQGQGAGPAMKNMELNWAIAAGDLKHRLEKLKGFLKEGKKVEVLFGPKRKGRRASEEESRATLKHVTDAVEECKGAKAVKRDGVLGGIMTVVFEGRKVEEKTNSKSETV
ncbi:hypothetical protein ACN47E_004375 [Coniothyrium glycines]